MAALLSQNTMLQELLKQGADPNAANSEAIVAAARGENIQGMLLLIKHGVNIHEQEDVPGYALHEAAEYSQIDMVKLLLDRGADVNSFGGRYG